VVYEQFARFLQKMEETKGRRTQFAAAQLHDRLWPAETPTATANTHQQSSHRALAGVRGRTSLQYWSTESFCLI